MAPPLPPPIPPQLPPPLPDDVIKQMLEASGISTDDPDKLLIIVRRFRVDAVLQAMGLPRQDAELRKRAGELLSYREKRDVNLRKARDAKQGQPSRVPEDQRRSEVLEQIRYARSQQRVVLRRLRGLRNTAASTAPRTPECAA